MSRDVMKLALDALEGIHPGNMTPMAEEYWNKAITALREALAEQPAQQEPVAWMVYTKDGQSVYVTDNPTAIQADQRALPLYTSPQPAQQEHVARIAELEETVRHLNHALREATEAPTFMGEPVSAEPAASIKGVDEYGPMLNWYTHWVNFPVGTRLYTSPPAQQEPVALEEYDAGLLNDFGGGNVEWWWDYIRAELGRAYEHYQSQMTTPQPAQRTWVGLTDEEIDDIYQGVGKNDLMLVREAEAKLREKNHA